MFLLGSILAIILGASTLVLQIYTLKARNPFFRLAAKKLLALSLSIVLIPSLLLCWIQEDYGKLVASDENNKHEAALEEGKFISDIILRWKGGVATEMSQLTLISSTIKDRLDRAGRTDFTVKGNFDSKSAYTDLHSTSPHGFDSSKLHNIISEAVTPTLKLNPTHPYTTYPATERYDEMLSVRSVHPGQLRMAQSGYPEAPEGYTRMPWKDGFVYVSTSYHINDNHVYNAKPYLDNSILMTLTPEGLNRMNMMASTLSQLQMQVAVIYKGKVRGVYDPQICVTDQFVINDIPETPQQIALESDILSQPRGYADIDSMDFGFTYPVISEKVSFPKSLYITLASDSYNKLWLIVYGILLLAVSLILAYLHFKTRPPVQKMKF